MTSYFNMFIFKYIKLAKYIKKIKLINIYTGQFKYVSIKSYNNKYQYKYHIVQITNNIYEYDYEFTKIEYFLNIMMANMDNENQYDHILYQNSIHKY